MLIAYGTQFPQLYIMAAITLMVNPYVKHADIATIVTSNKKNISRK